jgi:hypothetical protein
MKLSQLTPKMATEKFDPNLTSVKSWSTDLKIIRAIYHWKYYENSFCSKGLGQQNSRKTNIKYSEQQSFETRVN